VIDPKNLDSLQSQISIALETLDHPSGFSHNIISCCLHLIAEHHGKDAANETISDLELDKRGWNKEQ
jgi:hypothetical protein